MRGNLAVFQTIDGLNSIVTDYGGDDRHRIYRVERFEAKADDVAESESLPIHTVTHPREYEFIGHCPIYRERKFR